LLLIEPYASFALVVVAPVLLWPWVAPYLGWSVDYSLFAIVVTYSLMILIPIHSIRLLYRRNLAEAVGFDVGLIRLALSLVFLIIPFVCPLLMRTDATTIVVAPIAEEFFFRMYLFGVQIAGRGEEEISGPRLAYAFVASTVLFVIAHFVIFSDPSWLWKAFQHEPFTYPFDIWKALSLFVGGFLFCLAYYLSGTILAAIAAHATWNASVPGCPVLGGKGLIIVILELCLWFLLIKEARDALKKEIARLRLRPKIQAE